MIKKSRVMRAMRSQNFVRVRRRIFSCIFPIHTAHIFRIEYGHHAELFGAGFTLNWVPPVEPLRQEAVAAALHADVVLAFVGLSPELEGEEMPVHVQGFSGGDRTDIQLPEAQQHLLEVLWLRRASRWWWC